MLLLRLLLLLLLGCCCCCRRFRRRFRHVRRSLVPKLHLLDRLCRRGQGLRCREPFSRLVEAHLVEHLVFCCCLSFGKEKKVGSRFF